MSRGGLHHSRLVRCARSPRATPCYAVRRARRSQRVVPLDPARRKGRAPARVDQLSTGRDLIGGLSARGARGVDGALGTVVKTEGSTPTKAGSMMIVHNDGAIVGTIGGGALEKGVIARAMQAITDRRPSLTRHRLVRDHNMCCGGSVHVFINPVLRPDRLYIFGAGHIGSALARICRHLPFDVTVVDDREGIFDGWEKNGERLINRHPREVMADLAWDSRTFSVIATYSHPLDRQILEHCVRQPIAYCGMIGSLRKVAVTRALFIHQHRATPEQLDRVDMPIGLGIGSVTPEEIAISIAARLIATQRGSTAPGKPVEEKGIPSDELDPCRASAPVCNV